MRLFKESSYVQIQLHNNKDNNNNDNNQHLTLALIIFAISSQLTCAPICHDTMSHLGNDRNETISINHCTDGRQNQQLFIITAE